MASKDSGDEVKLAFMLITMVGFSILAVYGIGSGEDLGALGIAALSLLNGLLVGWGNTIVSLVFFDDSAQALRRMGRATLYGQQHYPFWSFFPLLIGTIFSIGGVIAVAMARSAASAEEAFKLGFFAEIIEGVVYNVGYFVSTKTIGLSFIEIAITLVIAVFMGCVAMFLRRG